jgi:hypothetical protein
MIQKLLAVLHRLTAPPKPKPIVHRELKCSEARLGPLYQTFTLLAPVRAAQAVARAQAARLPVIRLDGAHPKLDMQAALLSGKGPWKNLGQAEREKAAEAERIRREGEELVPSPEVEF